MVTGWIDWGADGINCGDDGAMYTIPLHRTGIMVGDDGAGAVNCQIRKDVIVYYNTNESTKRGSSSGIRFPFKEVYPRLSVDHYFLHGIC